MNFSSLPPIDSSALVTGAFDPELKPKSAAHVALPAIKSATAPQDSPSSYQQSPRVQNRKTFLTRALNNENSDSDESSSVETSPREPVISNELGSFRERTFIEAHEGDWEINLENPWESESAPVDYFIPKSKIASFTLKPQQNFSKDDLDAQLKMLNLIQENPLKKVFCHMKQCLLDFLITKIDTLRPEEQRLVCIAAKIRLFDVSKAKEKLIVALRECLFFSPNGSELLRRYEEKETLEENLFRALIPFLPLLELERIEEYANFSALGQKLNEYNRQNPEQNIPYRFTPSADMRSEILFAEQSSESWFSKCESQFKELLQKRPFLNTIEHLDLTPLVLSYFPVEVLSRMENLTTLTLDSSALSAANLAQLKMHCGLHKITINC